MHLQTSSFQYDFILSCSISACCIIRTIIKNTYQVIIVL
uniref:Uncharacterized protein n=1 Tax=Arundo donax TaxID=35708 RepID=A0A0A9FRD0_ARUDO